MKKKVHGGKTLYLNHFVYNFNVFFVLEIKQDISRRCCEMKVNSITFHIIIRSFESLNTQ